MAYEFITIPFNIGRALSAIGLASLVVLIILCFIKRIRLDFPRIGLIISYALFACINLAYLVVVGFGTITDIATNARIAWFDISQLVLSSYLLIFFVMYILLAVYEHKSIVIFGSCMGFGIILTIVSFAVRGTCDLLKNANGVPTYFWAVSKSSDITSLVFAIIICVAVNMVTIMFVQAICDDKSIRNFKIFIVIAGIFCISSVIQMIKYITRVSGYDYVQAPVLTYVLSVVVIFLLTLATLSLLYFTIITAIVSTSTTSSINNNNNSNNNQSESDSQVPYVYANF